MVFRFVSWIASRCAFTQQPKVYLQKHLSEACSGSVGITENVNKNKAYKIPIAHGEGRYYAEKEGRRLFQNDRLSIVIVTEMSLKMITQMGL